MTPERAKKWAEVRAKGRQAFVWRNGVLQWGLTMCGVFVGMQTAQTPSRLPLILLINVPAWFVGGLLFGFLTWHFSERSYKRYCAKNPQPTSA